MPNSKTTQLIFKEIFANTSIESYFIGGFLRYKKKSICEHQFTC